MEHDQRNILRALELPEIRPVENLCRGQEPFGAPCQPTVWVGSILVLNFLPKTKVIAALRCNQSMKRTQKYLWRPSGLGLAGAKMGDRNRPEGIHKLTEETKYTSIVMGGLRDWFKE